MPRDWMDCCNRPLGEAHDLDCPGSDSYIEPPDLCFCGAEPVMGWEYFYPTPLCPDIECLIKRLCSQETTKDNREGLKPTIDNALMVQLRDWEAGRRSWDRTEYSERDSEHAQVLDRCTRDLERLVRHKHNIVVEPLAPPLD